MEFLELMVKAEDPQGYKKLAETGIMVGFPVSINGKTHRADNGIGYHSTVKFFDPSKDKPEAIHEIASKLQMTPPDPKTTKIEPGMFKDRNGNDVYVLKLHGEHADQIAGHNEKFSHMGYPATFKYTPHVSIDKATWEQIVDSKAETAHDAGIKFHPAELKQGHTTLKQYMPPKQQIDEKLAASEKPLESLAKGQNGDWKNEGLSFHHSNPFGAAYNGPGKETNIKVLGEPYDEAKHGKETYNLQGGFGNTKFGSQKDAQGVNRRVVAFGSYREHQGELLTSIAVHKDFQRKGLATAMHQLAEQRTGMKIRPTQQTGDAKSLWSQKDRKFGKSEENMDTLAKGALANIGAAAAMAVASTSSAVPSVHHDYSSDKMLNTIAQVESSGGKFTNHRQMNGPIHDGEHAFGKYGLTPSTIRETVRMNHDLKSKYGKAVALKGDDMHRFMQDNPGLEDKVAKTHLKRLEHHFGPSPEKIGYAWLNGITGTNKAAKENQNIGEHWHVKKIKEQYGKGK